MKYIIIKLEGEEEIFIFPRTVDHDSMHEVLHMLKMGGANWRRDFKEVVSAGFITNNACYGRSETLDVDSRPELDTALLRALKG